MLNLLVVIALSYILGSFPTGIIAGKLVKGIDLREYGSGNTGATNTFRVLGWKAGVPVALIDMMKGFIAVAIIANFAPFSTSVYPESVRFITASLASVFGHMKPVFAGFRGGRGFGTAVGAVTAQVPLVFPFCLAVFFVVLGLTGYVSVCAAAAAFALPFVYLLISGLSVTAFDPVIFVFFACTFLLTFYGVRKKFFRYFKGEAEVFEKARFLRRKAYGNGDELS
jgi:acyl phosphate:glycerol-3-phosphate acyltransferase